MDRKLLLIVSFIGIMGFGTTWFLCREIDRNEMVKYKLSFNATAKDNYKRISNNINKSFLVIQALRQYFLTNPYIDQNSFEEFCQPFLDNLSELKALSWNPMIIDSEKSDFILENQKIYTNSFDITERNNEGQLISSMEKPYYIPVQYILPMEENKAAIGYNIASDNNRLSSIIESVRSNSIKITSPINLVQDSSQSYGFLAICPIFKGEANNGIESIKGVVVGVYSINRLISSNASDSDLDRINICVFDATDPKNKIKVFEDKNMKSIATKSDLFFTEKIVFGGKKWQVYIAPVVSFESLNINNRSVYVIIFGVLVTILSMVFYTRNYFSKREILNNSKRLKKANEEKSILLKEIHHRVKNNLQIIKSLLNLQANKIDDLHVKEELKNSKLRINSMALIHELLYKSNDFSQIPFHEYVNQLVKVLVQSYRRNGININTEIQIKDDLHLSIDRAIPLGMIFTEIISNSLKYAFDEKKDSFIYLHVIITSPASYTIKIGDNGIGYPKEICNNHSNTVGLKLIHSLTTQLEGTIEKLDKQGTHYEMKI